MFAGWTRCVTLHVGTYRAAWEFQREARMGGLVPGHKSERARLARLVIYKESAGGEEERTAAMAERTGVADHRATGVAVVGGEQGGVRPR
jgi:hypothetical protein